MGCETKKFYGNEKIARKLFSDAEQGKMSGAYLFVGPSKIGKFTLARMVAQKLQCQNNGCQICNQVRANTHPDTIVVDSLYMKGKKEDLEKIARKTNLDQQYREKKGLKTNIIGVDDVRQIIAEMAKKRLGNYKIVLIRQAGRLNIPATNALLKFIEELPEKSIVIMTATDEDRLLPTLVSRMRTIRFENVDEDQQIKILREMFPGKSEEQIRQAIWLAQGRIGRAIDFLRSKKLLRKYVERYRQIESLLERSTLQQRFEFAKEMTENPNDVTRFLRIFTYFLRRLMQAKISGEQDSVAANFSLDKLQELIELTDEARKRIRANANVRLQLENLVMEI